MKYTFLPGTERRMVKLEKCNGQLESITISLSSQKKKRNLLSIYFTTGQIDLGPKTLRKVPAKTILTTQKTTFKSSVLQNNDDDNDDDDPFHHHRPQNLLIRIISSAAGRPMIAKGEEGKCVDGQTQNRRGEEERKKRQTDFCKPQLVTSSQILKTNN